MEDRLESGVSPMVGTILVLGISVAGTAAALLLGAPTLQRLQEQSALDAMLSQFAAVDEAADAMSLVGDGRTLAISMPSGSLRIEAGTRWLVTVGQDAGMTGCDFRVLSWADGDAVVHVTRSGCRTLVDLSLCETLGVPLPDVSTTCFEAYRVNGTQRTRVTVLNTPGQSEMRLGEAISASSDYLFRLTDRDDAVYAEAWLLRTDQLRWSGGRVGVDYDGGAVVAHARGGDRAVAGTRVDEGTSTLGPALLVLPTLQVQQGSQLSGTGTHALGLALEASHLRRGPDAASYRTRIDLAGANDLVLCESLRARSVDSPVPWTADGPDGACGLSGDQGTTPASTDDDTMSLVFNQDEAGGVPSFSVIQMAFRLTLKP